MRRLPREDRSRGRFPRPPAHTRSKRICIMKWETPAAVDFRFGMEITMYIANR
jgi:coenzyme PQQ precursor peptide PqqA